MQCRGTSKKSANLWYIFKCINKKSIPWRSLHWRTNIFTLGKRTHHLHMFTMANVWFAFYPLLIAISKIIFPSPRSWLFWFLHEDQLSQVHFFYFMNRDHIVQDLWWACGKKDSPHFRVWNIRLICRKYVIYPVN